MTPWPKDVGIIAIEAVYPSQYVDQTELEKFDGVSAGKYTVGLGQSKMAFCTDREDINSLCLTAVSNLLKRHNIKPTEVGHLSVGTETVIDKSKSVKTVLMQLFEESGNTDMEGVDLKNACYGGTAALFNALNWVESSAWDGRYALVVTGDIAVYPKGGARPTGGAGAVALLVGADAPLAFDRGVRSSHMRHTYDFYKPNPKSEYPAVDGQLSVKCYLSALDTCYQLYCTKVEKVFQLKKASLSFLDAVLFHSPYTKLVRKSLARIYLNDFVRQTVEERPAGLEKFSDIKLEETYFDRDVEKAFLEASSEAFKNKTEKSLWIANQVGNMYTSSLYSGLVSYLINRPLKELAGQRIGLFSFGSGLASSMFSLTVSKDCSEGSPLHKLVSTLSYVAPMLEERTAVSPQDYSEVSSYLKMFAIKFIISSH